MKTLEVFKSELVESANEKDDDNTPSTSHRDPPPTLIMRRTAIRTFPQGKRIALYYITAIDKYISVPYNVSGKDDDISTVSESYKPESTRVSKIITSLKSK